MTGGTAHWITGFQFLAVLFIATLSPAWAQLYEDEMEPAALGLTETDSLVIPQAVYVGNDQCRQCHEAIYQKWLGTRHAQGFIPLRSRMAMMMAREQGVTASYPDKSGKCLACHATAHNVPAAYRGPGFRMGEGVTCEKCHGPGGEHVQAMKTGQAGNKGELARPAEEFCWRCHAPKKSHEKLNTPPFSYPKSWAKIAHP